MYCLYLCLVRLHFLALPVQAQHVSLAAQAYLYKPLLVLSCHVCVCVGVSHAGVVVTGAVLRAQVSRRLLLLARGVRMGVLVIICWLHIMRLLALVCWTRLMPEVGVWTVLLMCHPITAAPSLGAPEGSLLGARV